MPLSPGTRLGPYEITDAIGAGGMGNVYAAHDARLKRTVAIKVCREGFSDRFEHEARAIAALNHHHICTLYDVGPNYLVMEMVDGPTLAEIIATRPVPLLESLRIADQVAQALGAAHHHGIVHRDLKPANIKVGPGGVVKVLDFGLAKTIGGASLLPEVNVVNFLPRVKTPVLMVNGKYDSILPAATAQEPMFQQLGTPAADKRRIIVDSGHSVMTPETQNTLIKAVLDWFDKYL